MSIGTRHSTTAQKWRGAGKREIFTFPDRKGVFFFFGISNKSVVSRIHLLAILGVDMMLVLLFVDRGTIGDLMHDSKNREKRRE